MGLFDFFNTDGALNQQQNTMGPPTYNQMMTQMTDPRQMDTGMKLQMLGRAFKGEDVSGSIQDYQDGIRNRFRQRQQDQRQSRIDDLNRRQTELGMQNTQQGMDIANQKLPGQLRSQDLSNQSTDIANVRNSQLINQNNVGKAEWVGDNQTGRVMQLNPNTGALEDVTDQYTPAQIAAFKAAKNPAKTSKNTINPGTGRVLSAAELERDKQFGKNIEKFNPTASSGNIGMLRMIADGLATQEPGDGSTGLSWMNPFKSAARLVDRDGDMGLRALVDSESLDTQELVAGVIQKNLRETLGAQFTQREGMLLIQRASILSLTPKQTLSDFKQQQCLLKPMSRHNKTNLITTTRTMAPLQATTRKWNKVLLPWKIKCARYLPKMGVICQVVQATVLLSFLPAKVSLHLRSTTNNLKS